MPSFELDTLLAGKDDVARCGIARRAGERLAIGELDPADRQAAEALARALAADAVERVRYELSLAIRHAKYLPRDIALQIAHDVDSVACPFLEVTEVFSESDWRQLVLTISRTALVSVARRAKLSEALALSVAEIGDATVAEALAGNRGAPMTGLVSATLVDRFATVQAVLGRLAGRDDLAAEVVVMLTAKISGAAREKLLKRYNMPDHTEVISAEAEAGALLALVRDTPEDGLVALVRSLSKEGKLSDLLLLRAVREGYATFVATAIAERVKSEPEDVENTLLHSGVRNVVDLLKRAHIPEALHDNFWAAISATRSASGHGNGNGNGRKNGNGNGNGKGH